MADLYRLSLISGSENITINVDGNIIGESIIEKLLGVNVDLKLKFNEHLDSIFKKAGRKVNALSRIFPYMVFEKRSVLMNSLFAFSSVVALYYACFTAVQ